MGRKTKIIEIFNKNRLDQTDFNRVLKVPQADAQMNDYLKNLSPDRKKMLLDEINK